MPVSYAPVLWTAVTILSLFGDAAVSQVEPTAAAMFAQAKVVEEHEFNPAAAVDLYGRVAGDPRADASIRSESWLRMGLCLSRLGKVDEAKAAWANAAKGAGPSAARAADFLSGKLNAQEADLDERIGLAIAKLTGDGNGPKVGHQDLVLIGTRAIPKLIVAIENDDGKTGDAFRCVEILLEIGGPEVTTFLDRVLTSPNQLLRRTVALGFTRTPTPWSHPMSKGQEVDAVATRLRAFLKDADPTIRVRVFAYYFSSPQTITFEEGLRACSDPAASVRVVAWKQIARDQSWRSRWILGHDDRMRHLVAATRVGLEDRESAVVEAAGEMLNSWDVTNSQYGLGLLLEYFDRNPNAREPEQHPLWPMSALGNLSAWNHDRGTSGVATAEQVRAAFAKVTARAAADDARRLESRKEALLRIVNHSVMTWDRTALPVLSEIAKAKWQTREKWEWLTPWLERHGTVTDVSEVVNLALCLADPTPVAKWLPMLESTPGTTAAGIHFAESMDRLMSEAGSRQPAQAHAMTLQMLASRDDPRVEGLFARLIERPSFAYALRPVFSHLDNFSPTFLARVFGKLDKTDTQHGNWRNTLLYWFAARGAPEGVELFELGYRVGLTDTRLEVADGSNSESTTVQGGGLDIALHSKYDADTKSRIFRSCLNGVNHEDVWNDVRQLLASRPTPSFEPQVGDVICEYVVAHGTWMRPSVLGPATTSFDPARPATAALIRLALAQTRADDLPPILEWIRPTGGLFKPDLIGLLGDEPKKAGAALAELRRLGDPEVQDRAFRLLASDDARMRTLGLWNLQAFDDPRAFDAAARMLTETSETNRQEACAVLGALLDRRAVEPLLRTLRDPDQEVRKAARQALDDIDHFERRTSRWQKLLGGTDLEGSSVAEALLGQTAPSQPKEIRVAAIRSLGTLGVPECLPFLIKLMTDADADIAGAAKAAVDKINTKSEK